ncbi:protein of unknown function [Chryseobacterium sp. JV274]|nr:protein of unknown function [Chryseobacterium sp. JV274]
MQDSFQKHWNMMHSNWTIEGLEEVIYITKADKINHYKIKWG